MNNCVKRCFKKTMFRWKHFTRILPHTARQKSCHCNMPAVPYTLKEKQRTVPRTYTCDLLLTERYGLRLLAGGERGCEGILCRRCSGWVCVTLSQEPIAHYTF